MTDVKEQQEEEPSIEEILESIRQIISEDDEVATATEDGGDLASLDDSLDKAGDIDMDTKEDDYTPADIDGDMKEDDYTPADIDMDANEDNDAPTDIDMDTKEDDYTPADIDMDIKEDDYTPADIDGDAEPADDSEEVIELVDVVETADGGDLAASSDEDSGVGADIVMEELEDDGHIMSDDTKDAATDSFSKLAANVFVEEAEHSEMLIPAGRITLEQMTRELMRPMLKEWLDSRLPDIVESLVEKEIKKLADKANK